MANDDVYTVTADWTAVQIDAADIVNGTFSIFNQSNKTVKFIKSDSIPTTERNSAYFDKPTDSLNFTMQATEKLYTKVNSGTATIGVIEIHTVSADFMTQVQLGLVPGYSLSNIAGENTNVGTSFVDVSCVSGNQVLPTEGNPESWEIVSTSAEDAAGQSGTSSVIITSLADGWVEQAPITATVTGTTPNAITGSFFRGITAIILDPDGGSNVGNIIIRVAGGGAERMEIRAGEGNSKSSFISTPVGKTKFTQFIIVTTQKNEDIVARAKLQVDGGPVIIGASLPVYQGALSVPVIAPFVLVEKTDLRLEAKSTNTGVTVTTSFDILTVDSTILA